MEKMELLANFIDRASCDARISIAHIGLYASLLKLWSDQLFEGPLLYFASSVMRLAKISSTATYHKLIRDLNAYGYIDYRPSFYKGVASSIYLDGCASADKLNKKYLKEIK